MSRPVTISDEQILEAARIVFVRDGINATTKAIACEAGIAEGSIFRRFPTKEALFSAAMLISRPPAWVQDLDDLVGTGDPHENLVHIAHGLIKCLQEVMPLVMVSWANRAGQPVEDKSEESPKIRDRRLLMQYLQQEMDAGRLRSCNAEAVARMLFGACFTFVMERSKMKQPLLQKEINTFINSVVDALWEGLCPQSELQHRQSAIVATGRPSR
jgi:AcrR family transcriptional regulator